MSFAIWRSAPPFSFPAGAPEQVYQIGAVWVVTDDPAKATQANVDAVLNVPPIDLANLDNLDRTLRAMELVMRDYANALKAEVRGLATLLVSKGTITAAEANALLTYAGSGAGSSKTIADLKTDFAAKYASLP